MPLLTIPFIESLPVPAKEAKLYWDEQVKGFGIKALRSGRRIYVLQYYYSGGVRRGVIGDYEILPLNLARERAARYKEQVVQGLDPLGERKKASRGMTMAELCEQYMEKHVKVKKKARSITLDRRLLDLFILPEFGTRRVIDIERADIHHIHYKMRETPVQANHVRQVLSTMFNLAEKWGLRPDHTNPCRHVDPYPVKRRERYLTLPELMRLNESMNHAEATGIIAPQMIAAFRLLIFTGCRHGEIQTLKWEHVDFNYRCLRLPDSKTGAKNVQLGEPALELLNRMKRLPDNPYVIYGTLPGKYFTDFQGSWERLRAMAGLEDVRIHDLRHTFASVAVNMGESLPIIGKLLGHSQLKTTERYAHVAVAPQLQAADRISLTIAEMMRTEPAYSVLPALENRNVEYG
jgi:integrase